MSNVAAFKPRPTGAGGAYPDAPPAASTFERDLRLSVLASDMAKLIHEAAALYARVPVTSFESLPERAQVHFRALAEQTIVRQDTAAHRRALATAEHHFRTNKLTFEEAVHMYHARLPESQVR
jgi:hypothetical protein